MASVSTTINLVDNVTNKINKITSAFGKLETAYKSAQATLSQNITGNLTAPKSLNALENSFDNLILKSNTVSAAMGKASASFIRCGDTSLDAAIGVRELASEISKLNSSSRSMNALANNLKNVSKAFSTLNVRDGLSDKLTSLSAALRNVGPAAENSAKPIGRFISGLINLQRECRNTVQSLTYMKTVMNSAFVGSATVIRNQIGKINSAFASSNTKMNTWVQTVRSGMRSAEQSVTAGTQRMNNDLLSVLKRIVTIGTLMRGVSGAFKLADEISSTKARIDIMNDGLMTTQQVMDNIYRSAQNARTDFSTMSTLVTRLGTTARDAFSNNKEIIDFSNLIAKTLTISGASVKESSAALLQLSQAMASGVLRGDELRSLMEQAPMIVDKIADYLGVAKGQIKQLGTEGKLTADIVKKAMFAATDEINESFEKIPLRFSDAMTMCKNAIRKLAEDFQTQLTKFVNSDAFKTIAANIVNAVGNMLNMLGVMLEWVQNIVEVGTQIWNQYGQVLGPVIVGLLLVWVAVKLCTLAQLAFNAVLAMSPITWYLIAIGILIGLLFATCQWIANLTGVCATGMGIICGCINVVIAFFWNLLKVCMGVVWGVIRGFMAIGANIAIAFERCTGNVRGFFYDLGSAACNVIASIGEMLNKLPFVEFDVSGIRDKALQWAAEAEVQYNRGEDEDFANIWDEVVAGFDQLNAFEDGWMQNAWDAGSNFGDGVMDGLNGFFNKFSGDGGFNADNLFNNPYNIDPSKLGALNPSDLAGAGKNLGSTAKNTGKIAKTLDATDEELEYIRGLAEKGAINKFTTAEIKVNMPVSADISSDMDLDGIVTKLANSVNDAMSKCAEGVHIA